MSGEELSIHRQTLHCHHSCTDPQTRPPVNLPFHFDTSPYYPTDSCLSCVLLHCICGRTSGRCTGTHSLINPLSFCIALLLSVEMLLKSSCIQKAAIPQGGSRVGESQRMEQTGRGSLDEVSLHIAATGGKISCLYIQAIEECFILKLHLNEQDTETIMKAVRESLLIWSNNHSTGYVLLAHFSLQGKSQTGGRLILFRRIHLQYLCSTPLISHDQTARSAISLRVGFIMCRH